MNRRQPPSLATWLLEHLTSRDRDDALAGDLLEVHSGGQSDGWYWRQVASAIVIGCLRNRRSHFHAIVFAALWCMLAPAWLMVASVATERADSSWHVGQLQWPWSAIASLALSAAPGLIFVWAGF